MMRCEHCDRGQITGDSGICSSCGGSGFICAYEDETPMAVETTGVKVEWMDPVYRITFKGWFGEKTEVVLSTADVEDLVDAIQDLKQAFGKKSNRMSMLSQLGIKNKLLSAIALVDQAADEIDGEKQEQLKRISSVLFDINYDI